MSPPRLPDNVIVFPGADAPEPSPLPEPSFRAYLRHVDARELADAADCLAALLGLSEERAYHCTLHFLGDHRRDRQRAMGKIMRLRLEASSGNDDTVLALLRDCFGLIGPEAAELIHPLRDLAAPDR